jgi:hypothetical protein
LQKRVEKFTGANKPTKNLTAKGLAESASTIAIAPLPEKIPQELCRFFGQKATLKLQSVVQKTICADPITADHPAAFGICGAENDPSHTGMDHGPGTHRAWLQGHIDGTTGQSIIIQRRGCLPQGQHLGMGGRIVQFNGPVAAAPQDLTGLANNHGPDRHFAPPCHLSGFGKGHFHEKLILLRDIPRQDHASAFFCFRA